MDLDALAELFAVLVGEQVVDGDEVVVGFGEDLVIVPQQVHVLPLLVGHHLQRVLLPEVLQLQHCLLNLILLLRSNQHVIYFLVNRLNLHLLEQLHRQLMVACVRK